MYVYRLVDGNELALWQAPPSYLASLLYLTWMNTGVSRQGAVFPALM